MADIELVIKIPEDSYKAICNGWMPPSEVGNVVQGIKNGTPLPKGHGRLIDSKDAYKKFYNRSMAKIGKEVLDETPTIIEADKEQTDGNVD